MQSLGQDNSAPREALRLNIISDGNQYGVELCTIPRLALLHILSDLHVKLTANQAVPLAKMQVPPSADPLPPDAPPGEDAGECGADETPDDAAADTGQD